jgi:hypothetical protein
VNSFMMWALLLVRGGQGIAYISDAAKKMDEDKWVTPEGHPYPEPWNDPDPPQILSASEADLYFPDGKSTRQFAMACGLFVTLILILAIAWACYSEVYWLIVVVGSLALITLFSTIEHRHRALVEATEAIRRQRRESAFTLAVEDGTACLNCRRGKPENASVCPACGFNSSVYAAEAAAKKAARRAVKGAAFIVAKTTWAVTKGTAKAIWWLVTPTKKRSSAKPANPPL